MLTLAAQGRPQARVCAMKRSVLIVEDEEDIRELLSYTLIREGYQVATVASGEEALAVAEAKTPDLVLLDLMLPGLDGLTVCRKLRANPKTAGVAIIMLTAKGEENDIVAGLNMGANDYITKPFSRNVLQARIRAVLRNMGFRSKEDTQEDVDAEIKIHNLVIHQGRHSVTVDGQPIELSATEFRLLYVLARRPGWVFSRDQTAARPDAPSCHPFIASSGFTVGRATCSQRWALGSVEGVLPKKLSSALVESPVCESVEPTMPNLNGLAPTLASIARPVFRASRA